MAEVADTVVTTYALLWQCHFPHEKRLAGYALGNTSHKLNERTNDCCGVCYATLGAPAVLAYQRHFQP